MKVLVRKKGGAAGVGGEDGKRLWMRETEKMSLPVVN